MVCLVTALNDLDIIRSLLVTLYFSKSKTLYPGGSFTGTTRQVENKNTDPGMKPEIYIASNRKVFAEDGRWVVVTLATDYINGFHGFASRPAKCFR